MIKRLGASYSNNIIEASAPGKVILFGEHAVVYGEPSLVAAIDKRVRVKVARARGDAKIRSNLKVKDDFRYVKKAVNLAFDALGTKCALDIEINSEIPVAAGLGSSAAVSVATIFAISKLLDGELSTAEIAELGHKTELEIQGAASPTDTAIATYGSVLFIQPKNRKYTRIKASSIPLIVGYTGIERSTKALVASVKALKQKNAAIIDPIIRNIGRITWEAKRRLERGEDLGALMNINHGLLEALGVSTKQLSMAVYAARSAGATGAKLTGAGGGGCMIALASSHRDAVMKAIDGCGCKSFDSKASKEGVRLERS